ncbi:MAG: ABC transporter permease [Candidatus Thermoplasmatota archaeon]|jgi:peptide/nickel transport system permease protein|nr:ABC transporter permease [Candidatus Thermoplasmatota archaeon]
MELKYYIVRRLLVMIPTLVGLSILTFIILWALGPYQMVASFINPHFPKGPQYIKAWQVMGIYPNDPVLTYFSYMSDFLRGNWGVMNDPFFTGSVLQGIELFFPNTIQLAIASVIVSLVIAIPMGTYIGARPNSVADQAGRVFSLAGYAMPGFFLAYILIILFGEHGVGIVPYLNVFPFTGNGTNILGGYTPPNVFVAVLQAAQPGGWIMSVNNTNANATAVGYSVPTHIFAIDALLNGSPLLFYWAIASLVLPVATLTYGILAGLLRFIRAGMVDMSNQEFVKTARAKGIPEKQILRRHVRKNALIPTITVIGILVWGLLGGVVVVEFVFSYYGLGFFLLEAALSLDAWAIVASTILFGVMLVITNLVIDIVYAYMDPRIRY